MIANAIPKITDEFDGTYLIPWYESAFYLCLGAFQLQWFWISGDPYIASVVFLLLLFSGSLVSYSASNSFVLISACALAGLGASGILAVVPKHCIYRQFGELIHLGRDFRSFQTNCSRGWAANR